LKTSIEGFISVWFEFFANIATLLQKQDSKATTVTKKKKKAIENNALLSNYSK